MKDILEKINKYGIIMVIYHVHVDYSDMYAVDLTSGEYSYGAFF